MNKKFMKVIMAACVSTMAFTAVGCGGNGDSKVSEGEKSNILISGSSAMLPLIEQSIEKYEGKNPNVQIEAQAGGSGTGLTQVLEGTVDIGNSDVFAEEKLDQIKANELVDHKVIAQGFAVVASKSLGMDDLTKEDIKGIFSGKITNWNQVKKSDGTYGPDKNIFVIHRKSGSGTRSTFETTVLDGDKNLENDSIGITQDSNGAVLTAMKENDGAISYLGIAYLNTDEAKESLQPLKINGVGYSAENVGAGKYPFWSWGHMYTKGEPNKNVSDFIEFVSSPENKESLDNLNFISKNEIKID